jgi:hypothetical protein
MTFMGASQNDAIVTATQTAAPFQNGYYRVRLDSPGPATLISTFISEARITGGPQTATDTSLYVSDYRSGFQNTTRVVLAPPSLTRFPFEAEMLRIDARFPPAHWQFDSVGLGDFYLGSMKTTPPPELTLCINTCQVIAVDPQDATLAVVDGRGGIELVFPHRPKAYLQNYGAVSAAVFSDDGTYLMVLSYAQLSPMGRQNMLLFDLRPWKNENKGPISYVLDNQASQAVNQSVNQIEWSQSGFIVHRTCHAANASLAAMTPVLIEPQILKVSWLHQRPGFPISAPVGNYRIRELNRAGNYLVWVK